MKTIVIIILTIFGFQTGIAQKFNLSENYYVALQGSLGENDQEQLSATLFTATDTPEEITFFPITNIDMIHSITVSTLENPNLAGIKRVLKVDVNYVEYCTYKVSNYVLESEKGGFIVLPMLTNEDCGDSNRAIVYLFPSQAFGKENQILTSEITFSKNSITQANQEDSFIWNDDHYGSSGTLYQDL
ncbi:MAG: hypothetical protein ACI849_001344 [Patiriisocius sp.]|jgi:hypothetical protein